MWGVVKNKHIDYAQLIWDEMIFQASKFKLNPKAKIPFYRYTKLLISRFMDKHNDIGKRPDDKHFSESMDYVYTQSKIHSTSTTKQGMRIPDYLLTDVIRETKAYSTYDQA